MCYHLRESRGTSMPTFKGSFPGRAALDSQLSIKTQVPWGREHLEKTEANTWDYAIRWFPTLKGEGPRLGAARADTRRIPSPAAGAQASSCPPGLQPGHLHPQRSSFCVGGCPNIVVHSFMKGIYSEKCIIRFHCVNVKEHVHKNKMAVKSLGNIISWDHC